MARPKQSGKFLPTNASCVCSGPLGYGCIALEQVDPGCGFGTCPFYKTREEQVASEVVAAIRCKKLGITYQTMEEVIRSYNVNAESYQKRKEKEK